MDMQKIFRYGSGVEKSISAHLCFVHRERALEYKLGVLVMEWSCRPDL